MTVDDCIKYGIEKLDNIDDKILKVRLLLAWCMNVDKNYLIINNDKELTIEEENRFKNGIEKLSNNIPLQHITGIQEFYGLKFKVNENVLIPRFDTEVLLKEVLNVAKNKPKILDMCTGSGIIAISIAKSVEEVEIFALDISREALDVAKENNKMHKTDVKFVESDLFNNLNERDFDIIVSNPPYINKQDMEKLDEQVKKEPQLALYGGEDGLNFYRKIAGQAKDYLKNGGYIFLEIGYNQGEDVTRILQDNNYKNIKCIQDFNGLDRVIIGVKE